MSQRFFVGRGNNDALVRSVLKQRSWWMQYSAPPGTVIVEDEIASEVSFIWTQWKRQKIIEYLGDPDQPIIPSDTTSSLNDSQIFQNAS